MIRFFDYIFYRVSNWYIKKWKDTEGMIYGISVVSIMQLMHILFIFITLAFFFQNINEFFFERNEGKNFMHSGVIFPCLIVFACNFFRYFKIIPFKKAEEIWRNEEAAIKRKRGWGIIIYIILNIMITILLSLFRNYFFS